MASQNSDQRGRLIKIIHVARRELAMDEDSYRQMLANIPSLEGVTSTAQLSIPKLKLVLEQLKGKGFKVVPKTKKQAIPLADDAQSRLIRHLWLKLRDAGVVRDGSEVALAKFVANCTKVEALQWINSSQASQVIERLKKWAVREGVDV
ncbi:MAG TPA: regulatory protein GemA [Cellvibrio sp.]|nr:regulatory protein GemA [Cellvibrio sp.]